MHLIINIFWITFVLYKLVLLFGHSSIYIFKLQPNTFRRLTKLSRQKQAVGDTSNGCRESNDSKTRGATPLLQEQQQLKSSACDSLTEEFRKRIMRINSVTSNSNTISFEEGEIIILFQTVDGPSPSSFCDE
ncbi:hypothetical protein CDAR_250021 [Caerostris darwini]|uniref:Uncharacterized protein n=1 Tax=Caerostris darwini TaxID=1538125 RepID=A0AAV4R4N8_9ARAC|nr:hypothetical protein CDAR_250021 [Caerostris darwini]